MVASGATAWANLSYSALMMSVRQILLASLPLLALAPASALAASTGKSRYVEVALVSEADSIRPGQPFRVGLRLKMAPGWHTYWKNPGDAGLPTKLTWTLPEGFTAGPIQWPRPERISLPPLMSYGYNDEVLLPVEITPSGLARPGARAPGGEADWLECKETCLPGKAELELTLPVEARTRAAARGAAVRQARGRLPGACPRAGRSSAGAEAAGRSCSPFAPRRRPPQPRRISSRRPQVVEYAEPQRLERTGDGFTLDADAGRQRRRVPSA